jgi:hypothetical protein
VELLEYCGSSLPLTAPRFLSHIAEYVSFSSQNLDWNHDTHRNVVGL